MVIISFCNPNCMIYENLLDHFRYAFTISSKGMTKYREFILSSRFYYHELLF